MTRFADRYGFERASVTLANWRQRPFSRWSFSHAGELVPSARIRGAGPPGAPPLEAMGSDLLGEAFNAGGGQGSLGDFLDASETDCLLALKRGRVVYSWQAGHYDPRDPHIVFSITKSVTGMLAGIAEADGLLDPQRRVDHYLPEASASGYGDAAVRDLLDMRVSIDFSESYLNADGDYARYRRAMLWNAADPGRPAEGLTDMLVSLGKGKGPHGGPFHYQSPNSDLLAIVIERVTGVRYADYCAERLWQPMGAGSDAFITVDAMGTPRGAGGLSTLPADLARLGQLVLDGGAADGRQVICESWLHDMMTAGDETAWRTGNYHDFIEGGRYRSQWYAFPRPARAVMAVGIHGQWLHVCPERETVIVKLASQSLPQDDAIDALNIAFLDQLASLA